MAWPETRRTTSGCPLVPRPRSSAGTHLQPGSQVRRPRSADVGAPAVRLRLGKVSVASKRARPLPGQVPTTRSKMGAVPVLSELRLGSTSRCRQAEGPSRPPKPMVGPMACHRESPSGLCSTDRALHTSGPGVLNGGRSEARPGMSAQVRTSGRSGASGHPRPRPRDGLIELGQRNPAPTESPHRTSNTPESPKHRCSSKALP